VRVVGEQPAPGDRDGGGLRLERTQITDQGGPLWHPQTNLSTLDQDRLVINGGEGAWLTTEDGQRLLDLPASLWHANIGHGRARVAEAASAQMRTLETYHLFGGHAHRPAMQLAERLVVMLPMSEPSVFFTSGGSDSIDTACKLARRYWQQVGRPSKAVDSEPDGRLPRRCTATARPSPAWTSTGRATGPNR
jgi:adenosylmethionine-8-amino-7-oxononanoate aminotransferase